MKGTPTVLGHIVGNADLLAIRFRDTLKNRRYDLQLWIEDSGCLVCANPRMPAARRIANNEPERIIGAYTAAIKASEIAEDITAARIEYGQRQVMEYSA